MSDRDALDDLARYHCFRSDCAFHADRQPPPDLLWSGFVAMWKRIGDDCRVDFIVWAAWGKSLGDGKPRPHVWPAVPDKLRDEARDWWSRAGFPPMDEDPCPRT